MKNEKGITLIELLVAVAIIGIVLVPILTLLTGTFSRTIVQGKESQINYYAQEVIEEARVTTYSDGLAGSKLFGSCTESSGCTPIDVNLKDESRVNRTNVDAIYSIAFRVPSETNQNIRAHFYEIVVTVLTNDATRKSVELTTVVRKQ